MAAWRWAARTLRFVTLTAPALLARLMRAVPAARFTAPVLPADAAAEAAAASLVKNGLGPGDCFVYSHGRLASLQPFERPAFAEGVLACLYSELLPRAELQRTVDLGPFKHSYDEGLPLRKAAFAALDAVISSHETALHVGAELVPLLCSGLRDAEDVKILTHAIIKKLAAAAEDEPRWQAILCAGLRDLCPALKTAFDPVRGAPPPCSC
jgi:hypothetical protein